MHQLQGEWARCGVIAGVVAGLATAGLRGRHDDFGAGGAQQLERGKTDARAHQIGKTGDEQAYAHVSGYGLWDGRLIIPVAASCRPVRGKTMKYIC